MFQTFTCPSSGVLIYRLFHCRMWCYVIGFGAMMHGHTYIKFACAKQAKDAHAYKNTNMMHGHTYIKFILDR